MKVSSAPHCCGSGVGYRHGERLPLNPTGGCLSTPSRRVFDAHATSLFSYAQSVTRHSGISDRTCSSGSGSRHRSFCRCTRCIHRLDSSCTLTAFLLLRCVLALSGSTASLALIYQSQLCLTPCTDVSLIVFGSPPLSPSPSHPPGLGSAAKALHPLLFAFAIHQPDFTSHQGHRRSHRSPYFRPPNRVDSALWAPRLQIP